MSTSWTKTSEQTSARSQSWRGVLSLCSAGWPCIRLTQNAALLFRRRAKDITNLLMDESRLREARRSRGAMADRMAGSSGGDRPSRGSYEEDENSRRFVLSKLCQHVRSRAVRPSDTLTSFPVSLTSRATLDASRRRRGLAVRQAATRTRSSSGRSRRVCRWTTMRPSGSAAIRSASVVSRQASV